MSVTSSAPMEGGLYQVMIIVAPVLLLVLWQYVSRMNTYPRNLPYPPGPKPLPIIGNIRDVPAGEQWLRFDEMSQQYGDLLFLQAFGRSMLILGSVESAVDLLERRSAIYSDRPVIPMITLMGWDWSFSLMPYGDRWRKYRRGFNQYFNEAASELYTPVQEQQLLKFLKALVVRPEDFLSLTRFSFGSSIFKLVYGIEVDDPTNKYLQLAEEALEGVADGLVPGRFWIDYLPILRYIPSWLPGAEFKRKAALWKIGAMACKNAPFEATRSARKSGNVSESIVDKLMTKLEERPDIEYDEEDIKCIGGVGFVGGADTSMSTAQSFFLAMAASPEVQMKAQKELDEIVGAHRLPQYSDRASLPYIDALVRECLRWQPVTPLGVAHRSTADGEYRGYYIPKGTLVIVNQWALLHDPHIYPDPERFNPDRFLKDGKLDPLVKDPRTIAFGFGRRICPGRYFAENTLFLTISSVLHVFDISPPLDEHGQPVHLEIKMTDGGLSYPVPFKCIIKPRSASRAALIDQTNM